MEGIMLDLLNLDKLNKTVSIPRNILTIQQSSLLDRNDLICSRVQKQYPSFEFRYVVNICKMIFLEFDIALVFIIKHAGK